MAKDNRSSFIMPLVLLALVCLFLLQRGGLLLFGYSHIAHPGFDETASGVLASDLLDGQLRAPLFAYQYEARSGDGLVEGFLLVPFFKLFGRSLLSLKLCALAAALLCLLCWIRLLMRYHGSGAAIVFASLFAFPPIMFARLNLMGTIASHYLVNVFMAVQVMVLFRIMEDERRSPAAWYWLVLGLLAGAGGYAFYSYFIFNGFCLLFLLACRPRTVSVGRALLFLGGFAGGFSPWLLRTAYSSAGETYLAALVKNLKIDWWSFVQNFFFTLPHSIGYGYPSREMGIAAPLFVLFVLLLSVVVVRNFFQQRRALPGEDAGDCSRPASAAALQGIFFVLFPLFFLGCISLSPMKIGPFEYWPFVGFFGHAGVADVYRYRWLHPLFPFYFAIIGVGTSLLLRSFRVKKAAGAGALCLLIFFLIWGMGKGAALYLKEDVGRLRCHKGYNYDQMANRFVLGDMGRVTLGTMQHFIAGYPEENRGEAYRCAGTKAVLELRYESQGGEKLERLLEEIDPPYRDDFVYGIVRSAQMLSEEEFRPFEQAAVKMCPSVFYAQWGFRYLGYYYYDLFLNREKILDEIPGLERWFFKAEIAPLGRQWSAHGEATPEHILGQALTGIPARYKPLVVKGMGMLVGAEMCFDPLLLPDYPLDSRAGSLLQDAMREPFYEGVGMGFAETLRRFRRTFLMPGDASAPLYRTIMDREQERCRSLLRGLSSLYADSVASGFRRGRESMSNF